MKSFIYLLAALLLSVTLGYAQTQDIEVFIDFDNYPDETSWEIKDDATGTVVASGPTSPITHYTNSFDPLTTNPISLPIGFYTFTIYDSYGDGMSVGDGSYKVTNLTTNTILRSHGGLSFTYSASFSFVVGPNLTPSLSFLHSNANGNPVIQHNTTNNGNMAAPRNYGGYYLSTDDQWSSNDLLVSYQIFRPRPAGQSFGSTRTINIPWNVTPGSYYLILKSDVFSVVDEAKENDNETAIAITVGTARLANPNGGNTATDNLDANISRTAAAAAIKSFPNPFSSTTTIQYTLPEASKVSLTVSDITGRQIAALVTGEEKLAGTYKATFNGDSYPEGVYFYILEANGTRQMGKMVLKK